MTTVTNTTNHIISKENFDLALKIGIYEIIDHISDTKIIVKYFPACLTKEVIQAVIIK
jgi:hypothetical protein